MTGRRLLLVAQLSLHVFCSIRRLKKGKEQLGHSFFIAERIPAPSSTLYRSSSGAREFPLYGATEFLPSLNKYGS